jgi:hypothetical protein
VTDWYVSEQALWSLGDERNVESAARGTPLRPAGLPVVGTTWP